MPIGHAVAVDCPFCLPAIARQIVRENEFCYAIWTEEVPVGSAMVLPKAHRRTVFDLTAQEWAGTQELLTELRGMIGRAHRPDGWNVGWNVEPVGGQSVPHAHCHLVPRYREEPLAGRGIRAWLKDPDNRPPQHAPLRTPSWRITADARPAEARPAEARAAGDGRTAAAARAAADARALDARAAADAADAGAGGPATAGPRR